MTARVIIRDDDTSFFTTPEMLTVVYGRCWESGIPVCLSVIPARATARIEEPWLRSLVNSDYDPGIPERYRGSGRSYPVSENRELCAFINEKIYRGLVEVAVHGYGHASEFLSTDKDSIKEVLERSRSLLRSCFPTASLSTVVPPYECFSTQWIETLLDAGQNISTIYESFYLRSRRDRLRSWRRLLGERLGVNSLPPRTAERIGDSKLFFGLNFFLPQYDAEECLENAVRAFDACLRDEKVFVCTNHYYHFFDEHNGPREELLSAWHSFIEHMLRSNNVVWTTFENCSLNGG